MDREPDATDLRVIELLRANPRVTSKAIADRLALAETTIAQRIRNMAERNIMRVVMQKHIFADGYTALWPMFIKTSGRTVQAVGAEIASFPGVFALSQGIGNPDIFLQARARSADEAYELTKRIGQLKGVATVETVPCFRIHKFIADIGDLAATQSLPLPPQPAKDDLIFNALHLDGRRSNREVARELGMSEGAVRQRLQRLLQSGQMQFQIVCSPLTVARETIAVARITTETRFTKELVQRLAGLAEVGFVAEVAGPFNILAAISAKDTQALGDLCDNEILVMKGLREMQVQLLVANTKHQYYLAYFDGQPQIPRRK